MRIVNFIVRYSFDVVKHSNLSLAESSFGMNSDADDERAPRSEATREPSSAADGRSARSPG